LIDPSLIEVGENNRIIKNLYFEFGQLAYTMTHLYIKDADNNDRYEPPRDYVRYQDYEADMRLDFVGLKVKNDTFAFSFSDERNDPAETLITTENQALLVMDKYIQMDLKLPSQRIFGLGERNREFRLTEGTWTMWAQQGAEPKYDNGTGGDQTYGVHPFALVQTKTKGRYFGIYFRNSNAQSPVIQYNDDGTSTLSYITTGGVIDVYFMLKDTAKSIIKQY
jgi:alpha-glucosidase (family GH31 glycosyl hydrolase)